MTVNKNHADTDNNYVCDICEKVTVPANMTLASGLLYKNATSTIKLPDMPMESNHGTPTSSAYNFIVSAEMIDGSLVVTGSAEVVDGDTYIVIIPVIGEDNGGNKYKKYDVTVTLTGKVHGHDWTVAWGTNDTHHWRECANSDCDVTDITAKGEYGAHAYTNCICVCGKSIGNDGGTAPSYGGGYTPTPSVSDKVEITVPDAVGSDVKVEAKTITTSTLNDVKDIAAESDNLTVIGGKNSAVQITAKENGKALDAFVQPVTVTVPVSASALKDVADTGKLTLALVTTDDNGNTK